MFQTVHEVSKISKHGNIDILTTKPFILDTPWLGSKGRRGRHCICLPASSICTRGSRCPSECNLARDWPSGLRLLVSSSSGTAPGISRKCPRTWLRPLDIRTSLLSQRLRAPLTSPFWKNQAIFLGENMAKHGQTCIFFPSWQGWSKARLPVELSRTPTSQMQLLREVEPSGDSLPAGHGWHSPDE